MSYLEDLLPHSTCLEQQFCEWQNKRLTHLIITVTCALVPISNVYLYKYVGRSASVYNGNFGPSSEKVVGRKKHTGRG